MKPRVTFLIVTLRTFGAVRELVETVNRLSRWGVDVTVATPTGEKCGWLKLDARVVTYDRARDGDVVVMMTAPDRETVATFDRLEAPRKVYVSMGLDPDVNPEGAMRRIVNRSRAGEVEICADADWQLRHFAAMGCLTGVTLGGINTGTFKPPSTPHADRSIRVGISGDPRPRKGTEVVQAASRKAGVVPASYWGTFDQGALVAFYQSCRVFADNHRRAGWCNPVLEAVACGAAVVCSDIPASEDFARDGDTALRVSVDDERGFETAITRLLSDERLAARLSRNGIREAERWSYDRVARGVYEYLTEPVSV